MIKFYYFFEDRNDVQPMSNFNVHKSLCPSGAEGSGVPGGAAARRDASPPAAVRGQEPRLAAPL